MVWILVEVPNWIDVSKDETGRYMIEDTASEETDNDLVKITAVGKKNFQPVDRSSME